MSFSREPTDRFQHRSEEDADDRPHIGAATADAQEETCLSMVEHLVEAFEGKPMRDRVC